MSGDDLHYKELLEVAELIDNGEVSPVELTRSLLDRIEAVDQELGSYSDVLADSALEQAAIAEREIAAGNRKGPLHGVPIALKDIFDKAGVRPSPACRFASGRPLPRTRPWFASSTSPGPCCWANYI